MLLLHGARPTWLVGPQLILWGTCAIVVVARDGYSHVPELPNRGKAKYKNVRQYTKHPPSTDLFCFLHHQTEAAPRGKNSTDKIKKWQRWLRQCADYNRLIVRKILHLLPRYLRASKRTWVRSIRFAFNVIDGVSNRQRIHN
jgi:hypothetical protein